MKGGSGLPLHFVISQDHEIAMGKAIKEKFNIVSFLTILFGMLTISIWIVFAIYNFLFVQSIKIDGLSMYPNFNDGDRVLLNYEVDEIERYDVIVFETFNDDKKYVKRVYGLPNETIKIENGKIYINGKLIEDNYGTGYTSNDWDFLDKEITLGADEYFVLGDNRESSVDSRHYNCGLVKQILIYAKIK